MATYRRLKTAGGCYFFTVVTYKRNPILTHPDVRNALRKAIIDVRQSMPFVIDAWVLLPDHLHCVWTLPQGDDDYSARWSRVKRQVSRECRYLLGEQQLSDSQKTRREIQFWQRRFWEHQIRDEADFEHHLNYIHFNPVKHGYCQVASQWQWSTLHRFIQQGVLSADWGHNLVLPDDIGYE